MYAHGIHVLYEADGDHMILGVPDHLQLQLLPAGDRLLDQDLADQAGGNSPADHRPQLFSVIDQTASCSTHGVGRPDDDRVTQLQGHLFRILQSVDRSALGNLDPQGVHGILEDDSVLAPLDGIQLHPYDHNIELIQNACAGELKAQVEAVLPPQVWQQCIRPLLFDNLSQPLHIKRLNIGGISHPRIGHNGSWIGVDQDYFVSQGL